MIDDFTIKKMSIGTIDKITFKNYNNFIASNKNIVRQFSERASGLYEYLNTPEGEEKILK